MSGLTKIITVQSPCRLTTSTSEWRGACASHENTPPPPVTTQICAHVTVTRRNVARTLRAFNLMLSYASLNLSVEMNIARTRVPSLRAADGLGYQREECNSNPPDLMRYRPCQEPPWPRSQSVNFLGRCWCPRTRSPVWKRPPQIGTTLGAPSVTMKVGSGMWRALIPTTIRHVRTKHAAHTAGHVTQLAASNPKLVGLNPISPRNGRGSEK